MDNNTNNTTTISITTETTMATVFSTITSSTSGKHNYSIIIQNKITKRRQRDNFLLLTLSKHKMLLKARLDIFS